MLKISNTLEGSVFPSSLYQAFRQIISPELYSHMGLDNVDEYLVEEVPSKEEDYSFPQVKKIVNLFAVITDYKSFYTSAHSLQVAHLAYKMGKKYGYGEDVCERLYVSGAFHDVGKLGIPNSILEKNGRLDHDEFEIMKKHVYYSYLILKDIRGFKDICEWASYHHEKTRWDRLPFSQESKRIG